MNYRTFPGTDLTVSEIGFGVWTVSTDWWGVTDPSLCLRLLRDAFEKYGVTHFNTGGTYGDGAGETILREAFGPVRDRVVIATKYGYDLDDTAGRPGHRERAHDYTSNGIQRQCDLSLQRLGTDYIDLYEAHNPRLQHIDNDAVLDVLQDLQRQGKIRHYGTSLGPKIDPDRQTQEAVATMARGYTSVMIIYNMLEQEIGPAAFEAARLYGGGVTVRVPHCTGLLEGTLAPDTRFPKGDHRSHRPDDWLVPGLQKVKQLDFLIAGGRRTIAQAALKFVLREPTVMSVVPNFYNEDNLHEFTAACQTPDLTDEEFNHIQELYADNFGLQLQTQ